MTITSTAPRTERLAFLGAALRRMPVIGAIAPTSPGMARTLAAIVPSGRPVTVVELGPGTGAVSTAIRARLAPGSRHVAVEVDRALVDHLRRVHPWLEVLHGDAAGLAGLLAAAGAGPADAVVSTLPWANFPGGRQTAILAEVGRVLAAQAAFSTVVGLHALSLTGHGRRFGHRLAGMFDEVLTTSTVWRNIPPSRSYVCRRPHV